MKNADIVNTIKNQIKPISLMFKIDDMSDVSLYLRPEVAQTIFIEFKQFYEFNNSK
jgi:glycyl-tRNA synthetase (class II)